MGDRGPGPIAPDGSPVGFYARLPGGGPAQEVIADAVSGARTVLDLGCGTGRLTSLLLARGHTVTAVDNSAEMLAEVRGAETIHADIEHLDLAPRRFDAVVLASNLVNILDDGQRHAFLACCRRHVADEGLVVIERFDPDWAARAVEGVTMDEDGVRISIGDIHRSGTEFAAEMVYEIDGDVWRQPFVTRLLDEAAITDALARAGLRPDGWINARLLTARPASG